MLFKGNLLASKLRWEDMGVRPSGTVKAVIFNIWNNIDTRNTNFSINRDSLLTRTQVEQSGGSGHFIWLGKFTFLHCFCVCENHCPEGLSLHSFSLCFSEAGCGLWDTIHFMMLAGTRRKSGKRERTHVKKKLMFVRDFCMLGALHTYFIKFLLLLQT